MDPSVLSASQQEWPELISSVSRYLNLGHDASFELPAHNANWSKPETQAVLSECRLHFQGIVKLCRFWSCVESPNTSRQGTQISDFLTEFCSLLE